MNAEVVRSWGQFGDLFFLPGEEVAGGVFLQRHATGLVEAWEAKTVFVEDFAPEGSVGGVGVHINSGAVLPVERLQRDLADVRRPFDFGRRWLRFAAKTGETIQRQRDHADAAFLLVAGDVGAATGAVENLIEAEVAGEV